MDTPLGCSFGHYRPCTQCRRGRILNQTRESQQCDYIERMSSNRYDHRRSSLSSTTFAPYGQIASPHTYLRYNPPTQPGEEHCPRVMGMVLQREESEMLNTSSILSMAYNHQTSGLKNVHYSPFEPLDPRRMKYPVIDNPNVFTYNPVIPRYVAL